MVGARISRQPTLKRSYALIILIVPSLPYIVLAVLLLLR